eukprot:gene40676-50328_t
MKPQLIAAAELDRLETWQKYSSHMCGGCTSNCCTLPVEVKIKDLIRIGIVDEFERGDPPKNIAKRLQKEGIVERFNSKSEIFTLQRMSNNDCLYLDPPGYLPQSPENRATAGVLRVQAQGSGARDQVAYARQVLTDDRSHAPRGNASWGALRPAAKGKRRASRAATRSVGTITGQTPHNLQA